MAEENVTHPSYYGPGLTTTAVDHTPNYYSGDIGPNPSFDQKKSNRENNMSDNARRRTYNAKPRP